MPKPVPAKKLDDALPREVGGFQLVRELGRGGMGVVYEARELASGRVVALKVMTSDEDVSEQSFERFRREARMAASISDSNCVFVYGAHQVEGAPAIAMELCPGETLEQRIGTGTQIPIETAVRWTLEVLSGLEAAHRSGVVHRDVKPSNCFITQDEKVKVGDFGLSRSLDTDIRLTQSGAFLGSPLYASPEQIKGREVDLRSDIYSCGATLFALLSGRAPYHGQNIGEVLARILSEPPPPLRSLRPEIPAELEKVVARAMEREPERRFQDHASFRAALEPFLASEVVAGGRLRRVIAYALDVVLEGALTTLAMFLGVSQGWAWIEMDPARPGRFQSGLTMLLLGTLPVVYFVLCEGLAGATLAKWVFGLRVVDVRTLRPSLWRSLVRSLVFFTPGLLTTWYLQSLAVEQQVFTALAQGASITLMLVFASSMRQRNGYRGLHELASGTRVIQARSPFARFEDTRPVAVHAPVAAEGWPVNLGSYRLEGAVGPTPSGSLLQYVDQNLNRTVWMYARRGSGGDSSEARRSLARPGRLRWLDSIRHEGTSFEAFEAPGGASLSECIARGERFDWATAQRVLSGLADELTHAPEGARFSLEQVWIDRAWNPRLLDEPVGSSAFESTSPVELLSAAARLMLRDEAHPERVLPGALPTSAEPVARKLLGLDSPYASAKEASVELASLAGRPMKLRVPTRAMQLAVSATVPGVFLASTILAMFALTDPIDRMMEGMRSLKQLAAQDAQPPPAERMDEDDRRAREIVIANGISKFFESGVVNQLEPAELAIRKHALETYPKPTAEEVVWARERILARPFHASSAEDAPELVPPGEEPKPVKASLGPNGTVMISRGEEKSIRKARWFMIPMFSAITVGVWGVVSTLCALIFRGGLSLKVFGIGVRNKRGEMASRMRCMWRSLLVWVPLFVSYSFAAFLATNEHVALGMGLTIATALVHALAVAYAISRPPRGLQDRLAGTQLVAR